MKDKIIEQEPLADESYKGKEIRLCTDGKYRWVYEVHILRNPALFLTVMKVMLISVAIVWVFGMVVALFQGDMDLSWFLFWLKLMGIMMGVFVVLAIISQLILAAVFKGKYVVLYEMDENQVNCIQMPKTVKKAEAIGLITVLVGLAAKNPTTIGAGMLSASGSTSTSVFSNVRRVKARRRMNLIKVNQLLFKNQVYVPDEDYDFVYNHIRSHCPKAK